MKRLMGKISATLSETRGESLLEGVASVLVFTILVATVSMMIVTALQMTRLSTSQAKDSQEAFYAVIKLDNGTAAPPIEFEVDGDASDIITTDINVYSDPDGIYTAFAPARNP